MTKAVRNALAYVHLTGTMPKYLRQGTWAQTYQQVDTGQGYGNYRLIDPSLVEGHPQVVTIERLIVKGWKVCKGVKKSVREGICLRNHELETWVNSDGRGCRLWRI